MKVRLFGCRKFGILSNDALDRELTPREARFMDKHRAVCPDCDRAQVQGSLALNMLRASSIETEVRANFDERVIRRLRLQNVRANISFWSPAAIGAIVAGVVILAALQIVSKSSQLPTVKVPGGDARKFTPKNPQFPPLDLSRINPKG